MMWFLLPLLLSVVFVPLCLSNLALLNSLFFMLFCVFTLSILGLGIVIFELLLLILPFFLVVLPLWAFNIPFLGPLVSFLTLGAFDGNFEVLLGFINEMMEYALPRAPAGFRPIIIFVRNFTVSLQEAGFLRKLIFVLMIWAGILTYVVSSSVMKLFQKRWYIVSVSICGVLFLSGLTTSVLTDFVLASMVNAPFSAMATYRAFVNSVYRPYREGRTFRRAAWVLFVVWILNILYGLDLLQYRYRVSPQRRTRAKVLRSVSVLFARVLDGVRLPQMFRNARDLGMSEDDIHRIDNSVNDYLDWLRSLDYPIDPDVQADVPIEGVADGKYDPNWLLAGTNWRIYAPQLQIFAQPEFRKFNIMVDEYRPSFAYANLDNQLESIARYFYNPTLNFPLDDEVIDTVWDVVKLIYQNSRITPVASIYKAWDKRFNVGVYTVAQRRNARGGFRKLSRKEWIGRVGARGVINAFEKFARFGLAFDTHAQFFTKLEWLKPSKWMNNIVRTPVAAMLPEYIAQMVISADPNKRFLYERTPIKLGMPLKAGTFAALWQAHSRFTKHYAGDCTAFDSTIVGPVIGLIKAIRKRGFESHKDYHAIAKVIDRLYHLVEHAKLVSAQSGNLYAKGSGLMTGHASTSPDNSLVMVSLYLVAWKVLTGRSAEEFMAYNELSVYGDDHILSISDLAPPVWNWDNIVRTMASWGVTMREEVPSNGKGVSLTRLTFLKKSPRVPTSEDIDAMIKAFGPDVIIPDYITVHDPQSLLGKALAGLTVKDPRYRAKRLTSFLYLTAHNKYCYDVIHRGLEVLFTSYPNIREELGKYVPSYERVLVVWYTQRLPEDVIDKDDEPGFVETSDSLILYGEITLIDQFLNFLALVPDIVNPALRNLGPVDFIMRKFGNRLSWPKDLINRTNNCRSKGHLEALVSNSSYDWLTKDVPYTCNANYTTLIVRHWLYMVFQVFNPYSVAFYITGAFSKLISLNFMFNGYVSFSRPKFSISYWNLLLVFLLNFINIDIDPFVNLRFVQIPDVVGFIDDFLYSVYALLVHQIPASFTDVINAVHNGIRKFVVKAPTGTGKSTDLIYNLFRFCLAPGTRLIVIVPRITLAQGLSNYLNGKFDWITGYHTGDGSSNPDASVVFMTTGVFLRAYGSLFAHGHLFVLDECHLDELEPSLCRRILLDSEEKVIFPSATPSDLGLPVVELVVSRTFSIDRRNLRLANVDIRTAYLQKVQEISRGHNPWMRHLVFVDSFDELEHFRANLPGICGEISSRRVHLPNDVMFILATSSADVGVTIPNVDIVITKTFSYSVGPQGNGWYACTESLITQRVGRTGRTNNGYAYVISPSEATVVHPATTGVSVQDSVQLMLSLGLVPPAAQLTALHMRNYGPQWLAYCREAVILSDRFALVEGQGSLLFAYVVDHIFELVSGFIFESEQYEAGFTVDDKERLWSSTYDCLDFFLATIRRGRPVEPGEFGFVPLDELPFEDGLPTSGRVTVDLVNSIDWSMTGLEFYNFEHFYERLGGTALRPEFYWDPLQVVQRTPAVYL